MSSVDIAEKETVTALTPAPEHSGSAFPLADGVDADTFNRHYRSCLQEKKLQWLQRIFTGWHFYAEPVGLGFFPGKLYADLFLSPDVGLATILFLGGSTALALGPWLVRHRLRHNPHKRHHVFYMTALERCITRPGG